MIDPNWRPPVLETERLTLRPLDERDAPAVFEYASNPNVTRYTLFDTHRTIDDALAFVGEYARGSYLEGVPAPLGVILKKTGALIGTIGCRWASVPNRCMELGYAIGEAYWKRGYVTEAARALIAHVFAAYEVERVQAHHMTGNEASGRVMEKLGMTREGTFRSAVLRGGAFVDLHAYSVLRGEWK